MQNKHDIIIGSGLGGLTCGQDYEAFKLQKAEIVLSQLERDFP